MKTFELTGAALDWAVAKCEGVEFTYEDHPAHELICFKYSTDWAQGGPIIERECIDLQYQGGDVDVWAADIFDADCSVYGDTALVAAMRCYVVSKLGDEVEIPEELTA
jgi:hypothetical protein